MPLFQWLEHTLVYCSSSFFFHFYIWTLVTNVAFFVYPFVPDKQFLAEVSGDSDDGFDEVYETIFFCWFEYSTCMTA